MRTHATQQICVHYAALMKVLAYFLSPLCDSHITLNIASKANLGFKLPSGHQLVLLRCRAYYVRTLLHTLKLERALRPLTQR